MKTPVSTESDLKADDGVIVGSAAALPVEVDESPAVL
jgi:hypothetical protein